MHYQTSFVVYSRLVHVQNHTMNTSAQRTLRRACHRIFAFVNCWSQGVSYQETRKVDKRNGTTKTHERHFIKQEAGSINKNIIHAMRCPLQPSSVCGVYVSSRSVAISLAFPFISIPVFPLPSIALPRSRLPDHLSPVGQLGLHHGVVW